LIVAITEFGGRRASTARSEPIMARELLRCWPTARSKSGTSLPISRGLKDGDLYDGRSVEPTVDLRAILT
jgi:hypothetical protein